MGEKILFGVGPLSLTDGKNIAGLFVKGKKQFATLCKFLKNCTGSAWLASRYFGGERGIVGAVAVGIDSPAAQRIPASMCARKSGSA